MACGKWISTAVTLVLFLGAFTGVTVWTGHVEALRYKEKPKKHFLAWESRKRPEEYRHLKQYIRSNRRFDFSRERVISLTKSSFWNKRPYQFSTPVMSGSIIYVGADAGYFYAVDMRLKKKLWAYKTEGAIETSAAFDDEAVFFGDSKAVFYSLNAKTGKLNWKTVLDTSVMAAPLLLNDRIFVVTMSGRLFAIDRASGVEIWHTESHERDFGFTVRRASSPVFVNGNIYLGTSSGLIMAFDVRDGSIAWARQIGDRRNQLYDVDSKPLVVGDMLYVSSADGNLACIDLIFVRHRSFEQFFLDGDFKHFIIDWHLRDWLSKASQTSGLELTVFSTCNRFDARRGNITGRLFFYNSLGDHVACLVFSDHHRTRKQRHSKSRLDIFNRNSYGDSISDGILRSLSETKRFIPV